VFVENEELSVRSNHRTVCIVSTCLALAAATGTTAQSKYRGIPPEHRTYTLAAGVTERDVTFNSDGVACFARVFFPAGYSTEGETPGVVIAQGWTGVSDTIVKYGARFAEYGLVAMAIDYRGWGKSDGFVSLVDDVDTSDDTRVTEAVARVEIKRTRLLPEKQVEDIRNAISWLQGEPGVDRQQIGIWGSSYAGGHVLTIASRDARVKAVVSQVTGVAGHGVAEGPLALEGRLLEDAIARAREGQGSEFRTGFSQPRMVDTETLQATREYRPLHRVPLIPESVAVLFLLAENDELIDNETNGKAAYALVRGPKKLIEYPGIGHFDIYIEDHFATASAEAANWFRRHLGLEQD
jgi:dienelactone hydrolase